MSSLRYRRAIITSLKPSIDGGRHPVRRIVGDTVSITAAVIADGHDKLAVDLRVKAPGKKWESLPLKLKWNDEYQGKLVCSQPGRYSFKARAWVDRFATWQDEFKRRVEHNAPEDEIKVELLEGAALVREAVGKRKVKRLISYAEAMEAGLSKTALEEELTTLMKRYDVRQGMVESAMHYIEADPPLAGFAAWYELFPRSTSTVPGHHGTLDDAADRLERIRALGFDIVYLPPVHPIGSTARKGKDNSPVALPGEPGSPWAIGSPAGGHTSVHHALGGMAAFDRFMAKANETGIEVALDIAFQCSPDHPYVTDHPSWFKHRPDGTIRYAENPPKKYQDVYPLDFTSADYEALWEELKRVFEFWIERGVKIFRVDNPHTKSFAFWEWCIRELRANDPSLIFLAEAFTRPKTMYTLAKLGFNNSYTYFTWRNTKVELQSYLEELTHTELSEFFRPNFWPNTPDILHEYLVTGGRAAHLTRFILAATLSPTYGVYGPPFEHVVNAQHPDREEYSDNEKYEIRVWNWNDETSLQPLFQKINLIRNHHPALQQLTSIHFFEVQNEHIIGYCKTQEESRILCFVNLDPHQQQEGNVILPLDLLGVPSEKPFKVRDLLGSDGEFSWQGAHQYIRLNPHYMPAAIYQVL